MWESSDAGAPAKCASLDRSMSPSDKERLLLDTTIAPQRLQENIPIGTR